MLTIQEVPTLTLAKALSIVEKLYLYGSSEKGKFLNFFLYGKPGIGKSEGLKALTEKLGISFINIRLSQVPPMDFKGNPTNVQMGKNILRQSYSIPNIMPCESIHGNKGILLIDEFNMSQPVVEGMAQQLLDSRRIGDYVLPSGWMIVTANNLRGHGANVRPISKPVANRAIHANIIEDLESWVSDFAIPHNVHPLIIAYLRENPSHFYKSPQNDETAFPSPRTWEEASHLLYSGIEDISMAIGAAVASNFSVYFELKEELPDWDRIGEKGYVWEGRENISAVYAAVYTAIAKADRDNFKTLAEFFWHTTSQEYFHLFFQGALIKFQVPTDENRETMRQLASTVLPNGMTILEFKTKVIMKNDSEVNSIMN